MTISYGQLGGVGCPSPASFDAVELHQFGVFFALPDLQVYTGDLQAVHRHGLKLRYRSRYRSGQKTDMISVSVAVVGPSRSSQCEFFF